MSDGLSLKTHALKRIKETTRERERQKMRDEKEGEVKERKTAVSEGGI